MSFVSDALMPDERITCKAAISKIAYISALISFAITMHPFGMIRLARTELALTNKRVLGKSGGKTLKLAHGDIESITVRGGWLFWPFDYGTVVVTPKGGSAVKFKGVLWPLVFQQEADEAIEVATLGRKLSDMEPNSF